MSPDIGYEYLSRLIFIDRRARLASCIKDV
jgi:hypothetical protein